MWSDRARPGVKSAETEDGAPQAPAALHRQLSMGMLTLSVREGIGLLVRFGGIIAIGRIIGPRNFGVYAVASGATFVASIIAQLGVEVFLIRHHSVPSRELLDEIFSLLLVTTLGMGAAQATIGGVIFAGAGSHDVGLAVMVSSLAVPLNVLWSPAQGFLEHLMRYPALSLIEFVGAASSANTKMGSTAAIELHCPPKVYRTTSLGKRVSGSVNTMVSTIWMRVALASRRWRACSLPRSRAPLDSTRRAARRWKKPADSTSRTDV